MANRLENKVAIVTGAGRGIGKAIAKLYAQEGAKVLVTYEHNEISAQETLAEITAAGGVAALFKGDVSKQSDTQKMVEEAIRLYGGIHILCANAATFYHSAKIEDISEESWDRVQAVNLKGTFLSLKACLPHMKAQNYGKIVVISSTTGVRTGLAHQLSYGATYVREWLGAMVTGGVVEVDPTSTRYKLPAEHAAFLTRAAGADNIAVVAQYIAVMGGVEDEIVECFMNGGGVPYEKFPRFHAVMAEDSGLTVMSSLETHILPLVPGLTDQLAKGIRVLDVGCGSGRTTNRIAELYPKSQFIGMDLSSEAVGIANGEAMKKGLRNIEFIVSDLSNFHETAEPQGFDFITTFDAIHDQGQPLNVLKGIYRALKTDGLYLMQDIKGSSHVHNNIGHPIGTFLYAISTMHCMTVSLAQGGEGLGAMWGEEKTREYLEKAGFRSIETNQFAHDIANNWYVVRKQ